MIRLKCLKKRKEKKALILTSKKGNAVLDVLFIIIILFVAVLSWFFSSYMSNELNTDIQTDSDLTNQSKQIMADTNTNVSSIMDDSFIIALVLLWIGALVASFYIDTNAIFFVISLVLLIAVIIGGAYLSNAFSDVTEDADFTTQYDAYPKTIFVMSHLLEFIVAMALTIGIALYGKARSG